MSNSGDIKVDFDALLNFPEDYGNSFNSPSISPSPTSKANFATPVSAAVTTPILPTSAQTMSGPSHNYGLYPQQTGFVPGAIAHTMAVNQTNNTGYQDYSNLQYVSNLSSENDAFDFNTSPSQATMDFDLESPASDSQQYLSTVNPSNIEQDATTVTQPGSVGRLWPGAHSQAALAKAQSQRQHQQPQRQASQKPRSKAPQPTDPIVEQKITQLLNTMRAKSAGSEPETSSLLNSLPRSRKEEEEMDEDERLLASEEGKKLSSKERRQLRNKVSARAFRSRRKEYITQLEAEIATKVNENGDLRSQNRALLEENKRLSDLTRMLLSSTSFSSFLDNLSANPAAAPQGTSVKAEQNQPQEQSQVPKDVNPYNGQFSSQQQIGMAMIPESSVDFSLVGFDNSSYNFQPQVFVVDRLDVPNVIDAAILSEKPFSFLDLPVDCDEEKVEVPVIERPAEVKIVQSAPATVVDEEFESDPEFALFHSEPANTSAVTEDIDAADLPDLDLFGGIDSEKVLARIDLVDASDEEASAALAMARVQRLSARIDSVTARLETLTADL